MNRICELRIIGFGELIGEFGGFSELRISGSALLVIRSVAFEVITGGQVR